MTDPTVKVSADLRAITDLAPALDDQAEHRPNDRLMPGGRAMVALAGTANAETFGYLMEKMEREWIADDYAGDNPWMVQTDDWEPPLQTLLYWSESWRRQLDMDYGIRATLAREVNFLRNPDVLAWARDHEPHFDRFAADVRQARRRMEDVLYAGDRAERTEVPCIEDDCERRPRLIRKFGYRAQDDHYRCTACKVRYDEDRFMRALHQHLASDGAGRWVHWSIARDVVRTFMDRPEPTLRKWLASGEVSSELRDGARWVWWPDVYTMNLTTPRRKRTA